MNTLGQRLKYARRELTALKTAHPRGLGNLRVYRKNQTIVTPGSAGVYRATIKGTFSSLFAPYPFAQGMIGTVSASTINLVFDGFEYTDNGMAFTATLSGWFLSASTSVQYVMLTLAPVEITSVEWEAING